MRSGTAIGSPQVSAEGNSNFHALVSGVTSRQQPPRSYTRPLSVPSPSSTSFPKIAGA
jgi:hypothetical protein